MMVGRKRTKAYAGMTLLSRHGRGTYTDTDAVRWQTGTERAEEGRGRSQEKDADHEVRVRVADGVPEELPLEGLGEACSVVLHRLNEPGALCVGEERGVPGILLGVSAVEFKTDVTNGLDVHPA